MQVLSHRGYWTSTEEKNTLVAFERSFTHGFGIETDVRDLNGQLVVSHDPPQAPVLLLAELLKLYGGCGNGLPLALNIKSDGLGGLLEEALVLYGVRNYFLFDMSVPDALQYLHRGMPVYTRQSEYEATPAYYEVATGVWVDCFASDWVSERTVEGHLYAGKQVCLVSPELHGRSHERFWAEVAGWRSASSRQLLLCTDHPKAAGEHFHG